MADQLICPVDHIQINQNVVRITAGLVCLLGIAFLFTGHWLIPAFLCGDFFFRGFGYGKYSPLQQISRWIGSKLEVAYMPIDQAPKVFAAQTGFLMADLLFIVSVLGIHPVAVGIDAVLVLFSFLESVFAICIGCHLYTFLKKGMSWI